MEDDLVVAGEMAVVAMDGDRSCTSDESIHLIFNILDASRALSTPYKNRVSYFANCIVNCIMQYMLHTYCFKVQKKVLP